MLRTRISTAVLAASLFAVPALGAQEATPDYERTITRTDQVTIGGQTVPYEVTAGFQPVLDQDGEAIAKVFYTYYRRTDVSDTDRRPLSFSFNGGPGSGSLWMHRPTCSIPAVPPARPRGSSARTGRWCTMRPTGSRARRSARPTGC